MSSDDEVEQISDLRPLRTLRINLRTKKARVVEQALERIPAWPDVLEIEEVEQTEAASR